MREGKGSHRCSYDDGGQKLDSKLGLQFTRRAFKFFLAVQSTVNSTSFSREYEGSTTVGCHLPAPILQFRVSSRTKLFVGGECCKEIISAGV